MIAALVLVVGILLGGLFAKFSYKPAETAPVVQKKTEEPRRGGKRIVKELNLDEWNASMEKNNIALEKIRKKLDKNFRSTEKKERTEWQSDLQEYTRLRDAIHKDLQGLHDYFQTLAPDDPRAREIRTILQKQAVRFSTNEDSFSWTSLTSA